MYTISLLRTPSHGEYLQIMGAVEGNCSITTENVKLGEMTFKMVGML